MSQQTATANQTRSEKSAWWRAVLGEYPTGVCLITSRDQDGDPVGMVAGSFVAVSEDPPLVGFFAGSGSSTLPTLLRNGFFSVSVLGSEDEAYCRSFVQKAEDRWTRKPFIDSAAGSPRLADAVAWFDASVETTQVHGDHTFVVGRVRDFGAGAGGAEMPLIFRRAGYGSFSAPSETYDARAFIERLRWASMAEKEVAELATELGVEITLNTQLGDSVVTLASVSPHSASSSYDSAGAAHPWAAPIASVFAAWAPASRRYAWEEASRHLTGSVDRSLIEQQLRGVRERGYAIAGDQALTNRFLDVVRGADAGRESYARVWAEIAASRRRLETEGGVHWDEVAVVQFPVFGPNGEVVLSLDAIGLTHADDPNALHSTVKKIQAVADWLASRIRTSGPVS
jgi:flavin reductase (DIM6/NTAB) family NADH-FMN oxidoreductase RutF/DNA-binding IclR family transcriptional regulator